MKEALLQSLSVPIGVRRGEETLAELLKVTHPVEIMTWIHSGDLNEDALFWMIRALGEYHATDALPDATIRAALHLLMKHPSPVVRETATDRLSMLWGPSEK